MPFPIPLTGPQETTLGTSGYWARVLCVFNPNTVVFRAQAAETITDDPFIEFAYDNVDVGAYTDVFEGMATYLSPTTDIRDAVYRGRARLAPTSGTFYIDLNPTALTDGMYVIVTRDCDLFARVRDDTLIDGSVEYHDLPPMLNNHPHCVVLYDSDDDGDVTYTPVQTGIPVDAAATSIDSWAWDVSGDGTSAIDDPTLEHPTFTFEAGYHYLVRVMYEDDNGVSNYQLTHVYAVSRTFSAPVIGGIAAGSAEANLDSGWTATVTAYADVSDFVDRTHAALFSVEHFGDNSSTPIYGNVIMNGRVRSASLSTEGSLEAGRVQEVRFTIEGITSYLRRMAIPPDIVRTTDTPDEWGEITEPTPYRMAVYALWAYTTLTNICSFGAEDGEFTAYQIGGEPRAIDGGNAVDVLANILDPIHAAPNYAPSGEMYLARTASYVEDRSGLDLITTFTLSILRSYGMDLDSSRTVSQVTAFGGVYDSTLNDFVLYSAASPSIPYGDGGDARELTREILTVDSTSEDAQTELGLRASNNFAFENPKPLLSASLFDSYAGVIIPTNYQRWSSVLPASSNTLNRAWTATDYFQCQSVRLTFSPAATIETGAEFYAETSFDDAQTVTDQLPDNLNTNPVMPVLPNDPLFPTDPLELYPTDTPALDELQPIDNGTAGQSYTPWPPDVASEATRRQGRPGCKTLNVNFNTPGSDNTTSTWTTVLSADYLMTISGETLIQTSGACSDEGTFTEGTVTSQAGDVFTVEGEFNGFGYRVAWGDNSSSGPCCTLESVNATVGTIISASIFDCSGASVLIGDIPTDARYFDLFNTTPLTVEITITGSGDPSVEFYIDPFYRYQKNEDGEPYNIQLHSALNGLYIDNTKYASIPPFNASHRYVNLPFTGTGNQFNARMELNDATTILDNYVFTEVCRAD